jgi:hypothetical protein
MLPPLFTALSWLPHLAAPLYISSTGCIPSPVHACGGMSLPEWSLAIVGPNRELATSRALQRWNFDHHVFKIRRRGVCRGRARDRLLPAFPSYVFIVAQDAWATLRTIFGIVVFIGHGRPIEAAVNSLVKIADQDGVIPTPEISSQRFKKGDRVIYRGDAIKWLADRRAEFQFLIDENKAMIEIEWCGRPVPIPVDERDLVFEMEVQSEPRRNRKRRRRRRGSRRSLDPPVNQAANG